MRNQSHTLISIIREAVGQWRRREGWSRESVIDEIVKVHEAIGAAEVTGLKFDPGSRDQFDRMKANADRVFRWLDDEGKDNNLLPANFIPSILAALPMDLRLHCANVLLRQVGLEARGAEQLDAAGFDPTGDLKVMMKEGTEAQLALVGVHEGSSVAELENALREVEEAREAHAQTARDIQAAITKKKGATGGQLHAV